MIATCGWPARRAAETTRIPRRPLQRVLIFSYLGDLLLIFRAREDCELGS